MDTKELLEELCKNLEKQINFLQAGNYKKVEFFSGLRPHTFLPSQMTVGTIRDERNEMMHVVEISIDEKVVFSESYIPRKSEDLKTIEGFMLTRILRNVFNYGVLASKQAIENS